ISHHPLLTLFPYTTLFRSRKGRPRTERTGTDGADCHVTSARAPPPRVSGLFALLGPDLPKDCMLRRSCSRSGASKANRPLTLGRSEEHTSELQSRGHLVCR